MTSNSVALRTLRGVVAFAVLGCAPVSNSGSGTDDGGASASVGAGPQVGADDAGTGPDLSQCNLLGGIQGMGHSDTRQSGGQVLDQVFYQSQLSGLGTGNANIWALYEGSAASDVGRTVTIHGGDNASLDTCAYCLLVGQDCTSQTQVLSCRKLYFLHDGVVRFDQIATAAGDHFTGTYRSVVLREVTIDATTLATTPVAGGSCIGLDELSFDTVAVSSATQDAGADAGTDAGIPDNGGDPCATASDCASCTARSTCGWCSNTGSCYTGTATGPGVAACSGAQWAWTSSMCMAPVDASTPDAGTVDAGTVDAGTVDSGGLGGAGVQAHQDNEAVGNSTAAGAGVSSYNACTITGSACTSPTATCLHGAGQSGGVCSVACTRDSDCPHGGVCGAFGSQSFCLNPCPSVGCGSASLHCRALTTVARTSVNVCVPTYW